MFDSLTVQRSKGPFTYDVSHQGGEGASEFFSRLVKVMAILIGWT